MRLATGLLVALEVKGLLHGLAKWQTAADGKLTDAVSRYYVERRRVYHACFDPAKLEQEVSKLG